MARVENKEFNLKRCVADSKEKPFFTKILFDTIASEYNFITKLFSFGQDKRWKRILIENLPQQDEPICIDFACGTGDLTILLAKRFKNATIEAVDISPEMIKILKPKIEQLKTTANIVFRNEDMAKLTSPRCAYDIVTGGYTLRNTPSLDAHLSQVHSLLKPGGVAAYLDFSRASNPFHWKMQYILLKFWCELWSLILHGNRSIYGYIPESLLVHPHRKELRSLFVSKGFSISLSRTYFFGIVELLILTKNNQRSRPQGF